MFGYVLPVKGEMKVKDFEVYRAYYCGVCKQLHKAHGLASRFLLNYDLVLLAVLADAVSDETGDARVEGCIANPLGRRSTLHNTSGLALAADGLIMLTYHRLLDNIQDEGFFKRIGYVLARPFFAFKYKRGAARHPELDATLRQEMQRQKQLEDEGCASPDEACGPTAKMCEALFAMAATNESQKKILARLGLFCGQIVYLLDAAEDFEKDAAQGKYNVYVNMQYNQEQATEAVQMHCRMAAAEIAMCYNLLELKQYKAILDNIFFLGLPAGIAAAGQKRNGRTPKHGQIESV